MLSSVEMLNLMRVKSLFRKYYSNDIKYQPVMISGKISDENDLFLSLDFHVI